MMKNVKLVLRLMRYSHGFVLNCVLGFLCLAGGIFLEIGSGGRVFVGAYLIIILGLWPIQMLFNMCASNLVVTSPYKRALQVQIPFLINVIFGFAMFTLLTLLRLAILKQNPVYAADIINGLFLTAVTGALILVYNAICMRYFIVSTVWFIASYVLLTSGYGMMRRLNAMQELTFETAAAAGYLIIAAGLAVNYLLSVLIYRKPVSKYAFGAVLRKYV